MSETQGVIDRAVVPPEIDRWNWGAFLLNWIWGIGNNTFIALLTFVPLVGLVMPFVLGARGSGWAWRNGRWDSIEHFKRVQRKWAIWGVIVWLAVFALFGLVFGGTFLALKNSEAYRLGTETLRANAEAVTLLGAPISTGTPLGSISLNGPTGRAALNFSVTGTKAAGRVTLEATKKDDVWTLRSLTLTIDGRDGVIDLLKQSKVELRRFRAS